VLSIQVVSAARNCNRTEEYEHSILELAMNISSISLRFFVPLLVVTALGGLNSAAVAAVMITGAVSATVNSGGTRPGTNINDTFNQNGLSGPYVSDVTPFQPYVSNTSHTLVFIGFEWFSLQGTTTASVTYDLGELDVIDGVALWNEEASGIGILDLFWSPDNSTFTSWATGLTPTNNPFNLPYLADVFDLTPVNARYVRFDMSNCPQPPIGVSFPSCSIGEVAFRDPEVAAVPEPTILTLLGIGLAGLVAMRRRDGGRFV
jgi:hypothetical protein